VPKRESRREEQVGKMNFVWGKQERMERMGAWVWREGEGVRDECREMGRVDVKSVESRSKAISAPLLPLPWRKMKVEVWGCKSGGTVMVIL